MVFPSEPAGPAAKASSQTYGPLLRAVLDAQRVGEDVTAYPAVREYAAALVARCGELDWPVVWPVGEAAERLAGAAALLGEGHLRVRGWSNWLRGDRVLLVAVAALTPAPLMQAADHARAVGATEVYACGIDIEIDGVEAEARLMGYAPLLAPRTASAAAA